MTDIHPPAGNRPPEGGAPPQLSVIIATRNRWARLAECLESLQETVRATTYETIVVEDAGSDGTVERLARDFPWVRLLRNPAPCSWTVSNNRGVAAGRGELLLLLNDDTRLLPEAVDRTVAFARAQPAAGVVTPRILNPDGSVQPTVRRFPNLAEALAQSVDLHRWLPGNRLTGRYYAADFDYTRTGRAESVGTTCYLLRRACYEQVGPFDERFPPNFSDLEYNWRVREAGWETWLLAEAEVIHYGGATLGLLSARQLWDFHRGMGRMYRKHYAPRQPPLVNGLVYLGLGTRLAGKLALRLSGLDRLLHRLPQPHRRREAAAAAPPCGEGLPPPALGVPPAAAYLGADDERRDP